MKGFPHPFRLAPSLAVAFWISLGESCLAGKDWAYGGGPLPVASVPADSSDRKKSATLSDSNGTIRQIAGMMESLSAAGWADPRGGEYRELTIPGEADGGEFKYPIAIRLDGTPIPENNGRQKIRGWLLPKGDGNEQRYAVAWDGLVYPVIEIGPPTDLGADIKAALGEKKVTPFSGKFGIAADRVSLAKVVMLLRLGMKAEAAEMARRWEEAAKGEDDEYTPELYTMLVTEWLGAQFARAQWAHCAGRNKLALAYLEPIPKARAKVEENAGTMGIRFGDVKDSPMWQKHLELSFLNQVPEMIVDEQRRVAENVVDRSEIADPKSVADKAKRIALLIRDLEEVDAHPLMSKGYIDFTLDPVVKALVVQGEDAVEPLIDALANDHRLTKTVDGVRGWWYRWQPWRTRIVGVEEPALAALVGIFRSRDQLPNLDVPYVNYGPMDPKLKRTELAKVIQTYWEKNRGKPLVERWYGLLADDDALPRAWAEAAENLTLKESQPVQVYGEQLPDRHLEPGQPDPMRGEVLRHKVEPSVSSLMAKRLRDAYALGKKSEAPYPAPGTVFDPKKQSVDPFPMISAEKLAKALVMWDGADAQETLRWYSGELEKKVAEQKDLRERGSMDELIRTYIARKNVGDETALADYAKWVLALDAKKYSGAELKFFAPLWVFPGDPALAEVPRRLFLDPASPWRPGADGVNPGWIASGADTPLVAVPEYRALLLEQLENQLVVGSVELKPEEKGSSEIVSLPWPADESKSAPAPMQDLRLRDLIADKLTLVRGVPEFTPHWPKDKRDEAIAHISAFVQQYGGRWSRRPGYLPDDMTSLRAELKFPLLERPATKKDVEKGLAIFSNEGAADRRLWTLPEIPVRHSPMPGSKTKALWITYREDPTQNLLDGSTSYNQEVDVWQAEDALVAGQWKRTFGVVAKNRMAVVPGEEIELNSFSKSDGWQAGFSLEGNVPRKNELAAIKIGAPAIIKMSLRNLRGAPRALERKSEIPGAPAMKDLRMTVRLKYFPGSVEAFQQAGFYPAWKILEERGEATVEMLLIPQAVETLKDTDLLKFDLAGIFDLSAPGVYRMELLFSKGGLFEEEKSAWGPLFEVKE